MSDVDRLSAALADRYRIERELGAGGMATVYLAQDLKHDRQVAVKVLRPELAGRGDIWTWDLAARRFARLTFDSLGIHPVWSPDGRYIYYSRLQGGLGAIGRVRADGSAPAESLLAWPRPGCCWGRRAAEALGHRDRHC